MSDSWDRTHRRHRLVHAVLADIARTGKPVVAPRFADDLTAEFGDFAGFLREVQVRWYRAFDARLDAVLEDQPNDLPAAIAEVWRVVEQTLPAARLLLEAHAVHPALVALEEHHRRRLAAATGIRHQPRRMAPSA